MPALDVSYIQPDHPLLFVVGLGLYAASNLVFEYAVTYFIAGGLTGSLVERRHRRLPLAPVPPPAVPVTVPLTHVRASICRHEWPRSEFDCGRGHPHL